MYRIFNSIVFIFIIYFITSCSNPNPQLITEIKTAMDVANMDYQKLHHIEVTNDGVIVFFEQSKGLYQGFIEYKNGKWTCVFGGGSAENIAETGLSWHITNITERSVHMASGVISDQDIVNVIFNGERAKIVSSDEIRIWFVIPNNPILEFNVKAITNDGTEVQIN